MILLYSILVFIATVYLVLYAITFFNRYEHFHIYREVYKNLPDMKFETNSIRDAVYCGELVYYTDENLIFLDDDIYLCDVFSEIFDFYSWYWRLKFEKWFEENVDIDELPMI